MSFLETLDTLLLKPLQLLFEVIYVMSEKVIGNPGLSIIVLSLCVNFLILPLYMRADKLQEEEHAIEKKLQRGIDHIKKTFSGDERMMMMQTYYRQNNYKPAYVLRSAVSLFLQIPFFIAAYRFLSGLQHLNGVSFGPIADLGCQDGMLLISGISVNILPVIMTIFNLISCAIFTKERPLKTKLQLYMIAFFFLVFLYKSPAGLVFYWTLNNIFSLLKTIFYKLKNPWKVSRIMFSVMGMVLMIYGAFLYQYQYPSVKRRLILIGIGILLQIPVIYNKVKDKIKFKKRRETENRKCFFLGGIFLSILTGALIPSTVIKASPLEFVDITYIYNPLWFVFSSFCMALGVFVIWMGIYYILARPSIKLFLDVAVWLFSGIAVMNYMFFGRNLGILTAQLIYAYEVNFSWEERIWNAIVMLMVIIVLYVVYKYWKRLAKEILIVGSLALSCMVFINVVFINETVSDIRESGTVGGTPRFTLSRTGKNIIVLMIDKAIGGYIPYIFDEKPEVKEQFTGFTYYPNTISFGAHTNFASPALFGGYEYTPIEINRRNRETLESKQNEALKVMPVLFDQNGYNVLICDPPYAGYQWMPDLTIYDEYPEIESYFVKGKFTDVSVKEQKIRNNKRNFFCYGMFKSVPLCVQEILYDQGRYNMAEDDRGINDYSGQQRYSMFESTGLNASFMDNYNVLSGFSYITDITDDETGVFLMLANETTHDPMLLQEPEYVPAQEVDNTEYEKEEPKRVASDGSVLKIETDQQMMHYQANMTAMIQIGKWLDYMRENDVYDNTRIILVSDHGSKLRHWEDFRLEDSGDEENDEDISAYYSLLMVKDFNSKEFIISEEFMTNGDVPALAVENIIEKPINPFTGKLIDSSEKVSHDQYICIS